MTKEVSMKGVEGLREALAGATARPWAVDEEDVGDEEFVYCATGIVGPDGKEVVSASGGMLPQREMPLDEADANARAIVLAVNLAPALIRVAEAAQRVSALTTLPGPEGAALREALSSLSADKGGA